MSETRAFQAQTRKLLDLVTHSIYAHKDVFLRELVSNASDAIDKVRFEALTTPDIGDQDWKIQLVPDKAVHTLTIRDNGCGMTFDEVVDQIGTIAKSGAEAFAEKMKATGSDQKGPDLIGQFGVGFYSAFMVAKSVVLETCKHGADHGVRWESNGDGTYTIDKTAPGPRGTTITLHLRDKAAPVQPDAENADDGDDDATWNEEDYTDPWTLKRIVKKYSDFIAFPIVMDTVTWEYERDDDGKIKDGGNHKQKVEPETLNSGKALWTRAPASVEASEHVEFYKHLTRDWNEPAETIHFHAEGAHAFTGLVYLPGKAPFDLFSREPRVGLSLYVKRVFIADDVRTLVPEHLRFVRGLVDSSDLPLNVSRETIQHDREIAAIKKHVTKKVMGHLKDLLAKDRAKYEQLWEQYGTCLKEGFHYDPAGKDKLSELVLVRTTGKDGWSTFQEVADRCKEGQTAIWYLTGESKDVLAQAPQLEAFAKKGVEVVLFNEPVDEILTSQLDKVAGKELKSAARGELEGLDDVVPPKSEVEAATAKWQALIERLGKVLADEVKEVRVSQRLTESAVCLVSPEDGPSAHFERMMKQLGQDVPESKKVLEINPNHPVTAALAELAEKDNAGERFQEYAEMLLDQALLAEGAPLKNPARFAKRVAHAMAVAAVQG
jgi:molecular chaperone HtpG